MITASHSSMITATACHPTLMDIRVNTEDAEGEYKGVIYWTNAWINLKFNIVRLDRTRHSGINAPQ